MSNDVRDNTLERWSCQGAAVGFAHLPYAQASRGRATGKLRYGRVPARCMPRARGASGRVARRTSRLVPTAAGARRSAAPDTCQPPTCHAVRRPGWRSSRSLVSLLSVRSSQMQGTRNLAHRMGRWSGMHPWKAILGWVAFVADRIRGRQRVPEPHARRGRQGCRRVRPGDEGRRPRVHRRSAAGRGGRLHPGALGQARQRRPRGRRGRRHPAPAGDHRGGLDRSGRALDGRPLRALAVHGRRTGRQGIDQGRTDRGRHGGGRVRASVASRRGLRRRPPRASSSTTSSPRTSTRPRCCRSRSRS